MIANADRTCIGDVLTDQFELAWSLAEHHLKDLTTSECLWKPSTPCLHLKTDEHGRQVAERPLHEDYAIGPPSIGWTTWHMLYWSKNVMSAQTGGPVIPWDAVFWPGEAAGVCDHMTSFASVWRRQLSNRTAEGFALSQPSAWPIAGATFARTAAWLNVELTKNASELGVMRFLHAASAS